MPLLIWDVPLLIRLKVPLLIWDVPLLIKFATAYLGGATAYLVGGRINSRIRLTSAKVGVEIETELGNKVISSSKLKLKLKMSMTIL